MPINLPLFFPCRCVKESTYQTHYSPYRNILRFSFQAFSFMGRHPSVYLQCKVVVCRSYDYYSRCNRGCLPRSKRDTGSYQENLDVIIGPIEVVKDGVQNRNFGKPNQNFFHGSKNNQCHSVLSK